MQNNSQQAVQPKSYAERLDSAVKDRHSALCDYFDSPLFSLTSLMGPISDGPAWPSDAAWLACEHKGRACIVTDGLSDPWVELDRPANGLGIEVFISTPDIAMDSNNTMAIADTWLFPMIAEISHTLASYPRLSARLVNGEPVSLRCNIDHIKDGKGLRSILLSPVNDQCENELSQWNARLVAATLLSSEEAHWLVGKGEHGRLSLVDLFRQNGLVGVSSLTRASLL